jgi:predicted nucleic acid-binding Zn ribbon protein
MRRLAPRPLGRALEGVIAQARPAGLLAAVQSAWPAVAGAALAAAATPTSERDGTVTVTCESGIWAHELELLGADLTARLTERLEESGDAVKLTRLRFVVGSAAGGR